MTIQSDLIKIEMETAVPGLTFRHFRGEEDIPAMVDIVNRSNAVDNKDWVRTVEGLTNSYRHLTNCDIQKDMAIALVHGEMVGYSRCWWEVQLDETYRYIHVAMVHPAWRDNEIRQALLQFNETRLRQIAATHPVTSNKWLAAFANETETHWSGLLESANYQPARYFMGMIRPSLDNIPTVPVPAGIELRRGTLAEWRQIWEACREAFRDHWGESEWGEEEFDEWTNHPNFDPELFQIGWDGDEVAGGVCNYISKAENEKNGRLRGYTEDIFVRRPWRKRGLAKALIARSFQILKEQGMTEAALTVDAENTTGAMQLYTDMGFQKEKMSVTYHKAI
ncbi:MAG: putative acetyltransferase, GNAT [Ardenticatenaceae bacterium]|nr:MAG: putative acetyltransferase, GNAT [Ardenticatenaceae bacterium]